MAGALSLKFLKYLLLQFDLTYLRLKDFFRRIVGEIWRPKSQENRNNRQNDADLAVVIAQIFPKHGK